MYHVVSKRNLQHRRILDANNAAQKRIFIYFYIDHIYKLKILKELTKNNRHVSVEPIASFETPLSLIQFKQSRFF